MAATETVIEEVRSDCPTGVLIEFEVPVDTKLSSRHVTEKSKTQYVVQNSASESTDESPSRNYLRKECFLSPVPNFRKRSNEQNRNLLFRRDKLQNSNWRTPSPSSMKKIRDEASRIIDRLYTSPELSEMSLCDEVFPDACYDSDECTENKPEVASTVANDNDSNNINEIENTLDKDSSLHCEDVKGYSNVEDSSKSHCKKSKDASPNHSIHDSLTCNLDCQSRANLSVSDSEGTTVESETKQSENVVESETKQSENLENVVESETKQSENLENVVESETKQSENLENANDSVNVNNIRNDLATDSEMDSVNKDFSRMALHKKIEKKLPILNGNLSQHTTDKTKLYSNKHDLNSSTLSNSNRSSNLPSKTLGLHKGFGLRTPIRRKENSNKENNGVQKVVKDGSISQTQTNENAKKVLRKPPVANALADSVLLEKKFSREKEFKDVNRDDVEFKKSSIQYRSLRNMKPLSNSSLEIDTPNSKRSIRRSNSFQLTNKEKEISFLARPSPSILKPQVPKYCSSKIGTATPIRSENCRNVAQIPNSAKRTPIGANGRSAAPKDIKPAVEALQGSFKKPILSSNQKSRNRIGVPSALPKSKIDNLPRRLFSENKMTNLPNKS